MYMTYLYLYGYVFSELNVVEVAHDHQAQVMKNTTEDLQVINSYDTWHGELYFSFMYIHCEYRNSVKFVYIHSCLQGQRTLQSK